MSKEHTQPPQWERIELNYRAGIKSLRQIAAEQGISEGVIRKRAKGDDWSRGRSERILEKREGGSARTVGTEWLASWRGAAQRPAYCGRHPPGQCH
ncbi:MAG: hypothetical protein ACN6OP_05095 [Pseudomonadales bacterium]